MIEAYRTNPGSSSISGPMFEFYMVEDLSRCYKLRGTTCIFIIRSHLILQYDMQLNQSGTLAAQEQHIVLALF